MTTNRRAFIQQGALGLSGAWATTAAASGKRVPTASVPGLAHQGPKEVIRGKRAVASSQNPIVTRTMLDVLKAGGNAMDAVIAGSITQATVQLEMTNHTGSVSCLYWDAKSAKAHYLNSHGTLHPMLPPLRPYPAGLSGVAAGPPMACMPAFMPGMAAMHRRFGTRPWSSLVEPAIPWAEEGFPIDEFARSVLEEELTNNTYFPERRALFAPNGFTPPVGEKLRNPALAQTLRRLSAEGPDYFTQGEWAKHFVETAHRLGWKIELKDLLVPAPRWAEPLRFPHKGYEILQAPPPERQGVFCALVLGILRHLDVSSLGHYTESAESLYYMGQALRRAHFELGLLYDPQFFDVPLDVWMSDEYHARLAEILKKSRPKSGVDLTKHVELVIPRSQLQAFGWVPPPPDDKPAQPSGSCELSCVDEHGNWAQMMNTLQSGGIPGAVVDGVPMMGSHAAFSMEAGIAGWLGIPGYRLRSSLSNTFIFKDGAPVHSLGSPGNIHCTVPQMLSNLLDYDFDPYEAAVLPRMLPMDPRYTIGIETRIPERLLRELAKLGAQLSPLPPFDYHMGSYQQAWREADGRLSASTDPRRAGQAGGF